jgi:hypothetical protein
MDVYIVITQDRHSDTEAEPYRNPAGAISYAEQQVRECARHPELIEPEDRELTDAMRDAGWIWRCRYGVEGDTVRVVQRELRG